MGENSEFFTESFDFDQTDFEYATGQRRHKRTTKEQEIYGDFITFLIYLFDVCSLYKYSVSPFSNFFLIAYVESCVNSFYYNFCIFQTNIEGTFLAKKKLRKKKWNFEKNRI